MAQHKHMDSSYNNAEAEQGKIPLHHHCHHHHHHLFYVSPQCPLHRCIMQPQNHSPKCSFSTSNHQQPLAPDYSYLSFSDPQTNQIPDDDTEMVQDEVEKLEEEEDEEPVFVLTDEWREFFAKSEAKRRLAKKQAQKKGKI